MSMIKVNNLSFHYDNALDYIFEDVSFFDEAPDVSSVEPPQAAKPKHSVNTSKQQMIFLSIIFPPV